MTALPGRRASGALALAAVAVLGLSACAGAGGGEQGRRTLTVYAAASLTGSFDDLAEQFEEQNPGVDVQLSYAGSSTLVSQLQEGAPADVLAAASTSTMDQAVDADLVEGQPQLFATNVLTIAVPQGNPGEVRGFEDLSSTELDTVICEESVPCGAATAELQEITGAQIAAVSEEGSVVDVLGKVTSGQADAGVVYRTDVTAGGDAVEEIEIPQAEQAVNEYPIAVLQDAQDQQLARQFSEFVRSETGRQRLAEEGFGAP